MNKYILYRKGILFAVLFIFFVFANHSYAQTIVKDWSFSSSTQNWTTGNTTTTIAHYNAEGWPGIIYANCTGNDPQFVSPTFSISAQDWHKVVVRIATHNGGTHQMKVYWKRSGDSLFSESRFVARNYSSTTGQNFITVELDVGNHSLWDGTINQIRVDPSSSSCPSQNYTFHIDYVRILGEPPPSTPTGLSLSSISGGFRVSWNNVSGTSGATPYEIFWGNDSSVSETNYSDIIYEDGTPSDHTGLLNGNPYYYRIRACNSSGCSALSSTVSEFYGTPSTPTLVPLYRAYNSTTKDHFYTVDPAEKNGPADKPGYTFEKIEGYIYNASFSSVVPLYEFYYDSNSMHYYTTNTSNASPGYSEGPTVIGYVYPNPSANMVPMYHLEHGINTDHFFTISEFERDNAVNSYSFTFLGTAWYVSRNSLGAPIAPRASVKYGGIDLASGNFQPYYNHVDFVVPPGKGIPFVFARTYNAMNEEVGPFGIGWDHSYNIRLSEDTNAYGTFAAVKWGDGRIDVYKLNGSIYEPYCLDSSGNPTTLCGIYNTLEKAGVNYVLTTKDKTVYVLTEILYLSDTYQLTKIRDRDYNDTIIEYIPEGNTAEGNPARVTDATGRIYTFNYNNYPNLPEQSEYRIQSVVESSTTGLGRLITFDYDPNTGNLIKFYDSENNLTRYEYNADNLLDKIILPRGNTWTANYDSSVKGRIEDYTIDEEKTVLSYNDPVKGTIVETYSTTNPTVPVKTESCLPTNLYRIQSCEDADYKTEKVITFDSQNPDLPTEVEDKNGKRWKYTYNNRGNVLTVTNPVNPTNETTDYEYDSATGLNLIKVTDPAGNVTRYEYYANGNLWKIINEVDSVDRITEITRDSDGLIWKVTDPRQHITTYEYDTHGYPNKIIDPVQDTLGKSTDIIYDTGGRSTSKTDADGTKTDYTYDKLNNIKTVEDHQGKVTTYSYDPNGNLKSIDDPRPATNEKVYTYDNRDLLKTITEGNILKATLGYDEIGRLESVKNTMNRTWEMTYYETNNLQTKKTPLTYTDFYNDYDGNGNLKEYKDRTNRTVTYNYDEANRLKNQLAPSSHYTYQYYANGLLQSVDAGTNRTGSFEYTSRNSLKKYTDPYNNIINYTYDEAGNLETIAFNGKTVTYNYDARNLLGSVTDWLSRTTSYEYTPAGRLKKITYPNGAYVEYVYDTVNPARLKTVNNRRPDDSIIAGYTIDIFDELDAPEQITTTGGIEHQVQTQNVSLSFDENNGINSTGFAYNNLGEIESKSVNGQSTTYEWYTGDVGGLLKKVEKLSPSTIIEYSYDGLGNRISRIVNGTTTRYVLDLSGDMSNVIAETNASGSVTAYYIYGIGLIAKILADDTAKYYHYDRIGNTVALTDDSGNVTDEYAYTSDPYGISVTTQGSTSNPFKFIGQHGVMDEGNNLYFMRARFYDAEVGRFLNEDPLGFEGGDWNVYAYVNGNPLNRIDPKGQWGWLISVADLVIQSDPVVNYTGTLMYNWLYSDGIYTEEVDAQIGRVQKVAEVLSEIGHGASYLLSIKQLFSPDKGLKMLANQKAAARYFSNASVLNTFDYSMDMVDSTATFMNYPRRILNYQRMR